MSEPISTETLDEVELALIKFAEHVRQISKGHLGGHVQEDDEMFVRVGSLFQAQDALAQLRAERGK